MPALEDHAYLKICAQLAALLSISISSARRKVEIAAAREGSKDIATRRSIAEKLLEKAIAHDNESDEKLSSTFDDLLAALASEENFMIED